MKNMINDPVILKKKVNFMSKSENMSKEQVISDSLKESIFLKQSAKHLNLKHL